MNDKLSEQVSALADDELSQAEQSLVLRRLSADPALRDQWQRIHLLRDALHNELSGHLSAGFAGRVMAALESEPQPAAGFGWQRWLRQAAKPVAGLAVAASVAALAIVGLEQISGPNADQPLSAPRLASADHALEDHVVGTRWDQPQMGNRLNAYLVNHSEYTGSSLQGMMNYVRIAGYDNNGAE